MLVGMIAHSTHPSHALTTPRSTLAGVIRGLDVSALKPYRKADAHAFGAFLDSAMGFPH